VDTQTPFVYAASWWNGATAERYLQDKALPIWVNLSLGKVELYREIQQVWVNRKMPQQSSCLMLLCRPASAPVAYVQASSLYIVHVLRHGSPLDSFFFIERRHVDVVPKRLCRVCSLLAPLRCCISIQCWLAALLGVL